MNLSIPLSTVRCRIFYIKIYWKYERKKNKWVRIQTHWLLIQTHWLRIRGRVLIRGLNNLPILWMEDMIHVVFDYQVHVSTKHRDVRRAQQSRLMGTSDNVV